jgi:hypothetical protein
MDLILQFSQILFFFLDIFFILFVCEWVHAGLDVFWLFFHHPLMFVLNLFDAACTVSGHIILSNWVKNHSGSLISGSHTFLDSEFLPLGHRLLLWDRFFTRQNDARFWQRHAELRFRVFQNLAIFTSRFKFLSLFQIEQRREEAC